jgi:hypothetical protein
MKEKHTCEFERFVHWRRIHCGKTAKYHEGDKWYCGMHAPSKVEARRKKREDEQRLIWKRQDKIDKRFYQEHSWGRVIHDLDVAGEYDTASLLKEKAASLSIEPQKPTGSFKP